MSGLDAAIRAKLELVETNRDLWFAVDSFEADVRGMLAALTAVLDLHEPVSAGIPNKPYIVDCAVCREGFSPVGYPCDTIEAIAGKLGVEVDDG